MQWFNDSAEDIRSCCDKALQALHAHYGWQVRPVTRVLLACDGFIDRLKLSRWRTHAWNLVPALHMYV